MKLLRFLAVPVYTARTALNLTLRKKPKRKQHDALLKSAPGFCLQ